MINYTFDNSIKILNIESGLKYGQSLTLVIIVTSDYITLSRKLHYTDLFNCNL